jgi:hypothetical protein
MQFDAGIRESAQRRDHRPVFGQFGVFVPRPHFENVAQQEQPPGLAGPTVEQRDERRVQVGCG